MKAGECPRVRLRYAADARADGVRGVKRRMSAGACGGCALSDFCGVKGYSASSASGSSMWMQSGRSGTSMPRATHDSPRSSSMEAV